MPEVFHVNWFRKSSEGKFLWPGFGENVRVLEWIFDRCGETRRRGNASETAVGYVPKKLNIEGLSEEPDMEQLFSLDKDFWNEEIKAFRKYLDEQVGQFVPKKIHDQIEDLQERVNKM